MEIDLSKALAYSQDCLQNRAKLRAILLDLYPERNRDINIILAVYDSEIPQEMIRIGKVDISMQSSLFIQRLEEQYGLQRTSAIEGLYAWIDCLEKVGMVTTNKTQCKLQTNSTFLLENYYSKLENIRRKKKKTKRILKSSLLTLIAVFVVVGVLIINYSKKLSEFPFDINTIKKMEVNDVIDYLNEAGFYDIVIKERDYGYEKEGTILNISIGDEDIDKGEKYRKDSKIIIIVSSKNRKNIKEIIDQTANPRKELANCLKNEGFKSVTEKWIITTEISFKDKYYIFMEDERYNDNDTYVPYNTQINICFYIYIDYKGKKLEYVENTFRDYGFENVKTTKVVSENGKMIGRVEHISIYGIDYLDDNTDVTRYTLINIFYYVDGKKLDYSSEELKNKKMDEVFNYFKNKLGINNVVLKSKESYDHDNQKVEIVYIDGKSFFEKGDFIMEDSEVVIYYWYKK